MPDAIRTSYRHLAGAIALVGLALAATSCEWDGRASPTPLVTLDIAYTSPGTREPPQEVSGWLPGCLHHNAPLLDKTARVSWAPEVVRRSTGARVLLEPTAPNVYRGRLIDAPTGVPIRISLPDLSLCYWRETVLATSGMTVNGTVLTQLVENAPLGTGFLFFVNRDGTISQGAPAL